MGFVNYVDLTPPQKSAAILARPKWSQETFARMMFWVRPNGHISRRAGHHQLTNAESEAIYNGLENSRDRGQPLSPPGKGDVREWKPGVTFSVNKEPTTPIRLRPNGAR
jgi:hypothetical protein